MAGIKENTQTDGRIPEGTGFSDAHGHPEEICQQRHTGGESMLRPIAEKSYHAVSLSGGKDSTCMLILMIERGMPIDIVLSADTGMEFPEMYGHLAKVDEYLYRERGIHITTLRHPKGFEWLMFDDPKKRPDAIKRRLEGGIPLCGNGWPGIRVRWCTGQLKTHLIDREVNRIKAEKNALHYVGIAADEAGRCKTGPVYPLVEWGITEKEALKICYDHGFDFGGLYEIYHRASCWCCPFQRIGELRRLRSHHPELWKKLGELDRRARAQFGTGPLGQFKERWSVEALELRFRREESEDGSDGTGMKESGNGSDGTGMKGGCGQYAGGSQG